MNKKQKIVQQAFLNDEEKVIQMLDETYTKALKDIQKEAKKLQHQIDQLDTTYKALEDQLTDEEKEKLLSQQRSKIYQKKYQDSLEKQVSGILDTMHDEEFKTVDDYLNKCYEEGFLGTMYDLQGQGIPLCFPMDQEAVVRAVQLDSKISKGLYTKLGEDIADLKKRISSTVSRGISTGMSFQQMAQQLAGQTNIGYNKAIRIARTEGHRVQVQSGMDACYKAQEVGADVVKQWDATLDGRTRPRHKKVDGEIRELDEPFSNGLMFPSDPNGGAAEVINCRCALLQRARWALDDDELETLKERADFFGLDKNDSFDDFKKKYLNATQAAEPDVKPKKEYLTKKKLEQKLADGQKQMDDLDDQFKKTTGLSYDDFKKKHNSVDEAFDGIDEAYTIKTSQKKMDVLEKKYGGYDELWDKGSKADQKLYGILDDKSFNAADELHQKGKSVFDFGDYDDIVDQYKNKTAAKKLSKEMDDLQDQMDDWQDKLDKKVVAEKTKKLKKEQILLQDQLDQFDDTETFDGIWYKQDDITIKDWKSKQSSIQKKIDYYEDQIKKATSQDDIDKFNDLLNKTKDFDNKGKAYWKVKDQLDDTTTELKKLQKSGKISSKDLDAFTQDRKDAAMWAKNTKDADARLRDTCSDVWKKGSQQERYAIYDYTSGSGKFNRPLSGFEKPYHEYGSGWEPKYNKGVGKVWIDYEGAGDEIRHMTNLISQSTYDFDMWLQRGCGGNAMESFLGLSPDTFKYMSDSELQQFVGRSNRMYSFTSTGVAKGKGFSGDCILNIYAPQGTQMMYAEPFSAFGRGSGLHWDGVSTQSSFGYESEMIIQRGASYTITKIEKSGSTIYIDMEVHPEQGYDLIQQDPSEWKGSTKKGR